MKNHGVGKDVMKMDIIIIFLACMAILNIMCVEIVPAQHSKKNFVHEINSKDIFEDLPPSKLPKNFERIVTEPEISIDYTLHPTNRDGKMFWRLAVRDGGLECGSQGEERPFYKYLITTFGEIEQIKVDFSGPVKVPATPTPYLVPQVLGSSEEVLSDFWEGAIKGEITADWELNHLSKTTIENSRGELYSLKVYPMEFSMDGSARIYTKVKVSYSTPQNYMWSNLTTLDPGHKPTGPIKYLIITHPDLLNTVESFANWKSQKGLFTQVITTSELDEMYPEGDLQLKMRNYVQKLENQYDLDYLLLVGDWDTVPTRNTKNSYAQPMMGEPETFASDLYFACVDMNTNWNNDGDSDYAEESELDDCVPDMANGRLAINSPSVLSSVLSGLITHEQDPTWVVSSSKSVYMCGDPGYMPGDPTEVMDYFWTQYGDDIFTDRETIYYDDSGTLVFLSSSFQEVMDLHPQALCYFGHGQPSGFPELFSTSQVPELLSNGTDGSMFAMACLTGWFDDPEQGTSMGAVENCLAEALTETPDKGVVGYIGSSRMAVGYIDTTYSDDAPGLEEDYWRAVRKVAKGIITANVGSVWRAAITNFASSFYPFRSQSFDNPGLRTFLEYNLLGEPDAPLILRQPQELMLEYELSSDKSLVWAKVTNSTGAPVAEANVAVYRAGELGRVARTSADGTVTINIPSNNGGVINITASKTGDKPVNYTFWLPDNLAPNTVYSVDPDEPDGENDYYVSCPVVKLTGDEAVDVHYRVDDGEIIYQDSSATITVPDGLHTIHFRVVDSEGQWSDWSMVNISVDLTAPEIFITTDPENPDGSEGWFVTKPTIKVTSNEPLNYTSCKMDDGEETGYTTSIQVDEGIHEYSFIAYDLAGNMKQDSLTVKVDILPPVSAINISHPPDGEKGYYVTSPNIVIESLNELGIRLEYRWDDGAWKEYISSIMPPNGVHTLYYRGVDCAGNYEIQHYMTFKLDFEAPELELSVEPTNPDGENGFYRSSPVIDIVSDSGEIYYHLADYAEEFDWSETSGERFDGELIVLDGKWILYARAVDLAGNIGYLEPLTLKVDTIPPAIIWEVSTEVADGDSGWYTTSPAVTLTSDSPGTKLYWTYSDSENWNDYNHDITLTSGEYKLKLKAVDPAGNEFNTETDWLKVDLESPQVTIAQPSSDAIVCTSVLVTWHGSDALSGIHQYKIRLDSKAWQELGTETQLEFENLKNGKHTVHIAAYDSAGNCIEEKRTFSVDALAPTITSRIPKGKNVCTDTRLVITFSEPMRKDSVKIDMDGVTGSISWEGKSAIFTPDQKLEYSTKYNVKVTGYDIYNNSLESNNWYFYTESAPESEDNSLLPMFIGIAIVFMVTVIIGACVALIFYRRKQKSVQNSK